MRVNVHMTGSAITSETLFADANDPRGPWRVVLPRENDVEYGVEHRGDHFFVLIRDKARPNQELLVAPVSDPTATKVRGSCGAAAAASVDFSMSRSSVHSCTCMTSRLQATADPLSCPPCWKPSEEQLLTHNLGPAPGRCSYLTATTSSWRVR